MGHAAYLRFRSDPELDSALLPFENSGDASDLGAPRRARRPDSRGACFCGGAERLEPGKAACEGAASAAGFCGNVCGGAIDLRTGEQLFALNGTLALAPASNEKLALTFALFSSFSPKTRIETRVEAAGVQDGDTLHGNLVLVGGGDPTLSTRDLARLARRVRATGIRHVTGGVVGDETLFDSKRTCPGWKHSFYIGESPPLSALVVDCARYRTYTAPRPAKAAALLFRDALRAAGGHRGVHGSAQRQLHRRGAAEAAFPDQRRPRQ